MKKYKVLTNLFKGFEKGNMVVKYDKTDLTPHYYSKIGHLSGTPHLPVEFVVKTTPEYFEEVKIQSLSSEYMKHEDTHLDNKEDLYDHIIRKFKALVEYYYEDEKIKTTINSGYRKDEQESFIYIGVKKR